MLRLHDSAKMDAVSERGGIVWQNGKTNSRLSAYSNGVEYLLTWNYKHLANAAMRTSIEEICRANRYEPSIICTPEELLEV